MNDPFVATEAKSGLTAFGQLPPLYWRRGMFLPQQELSEVPGPRLS